MNLDIVPVSERPFPHVVVDNFLDADLYRRLSETFPECQANSGPTGYTCFWGDEDYARLMEAEPAWRQLFASVHCQQFIDYSIKQFRDTFESEAVLDLTKARYTPFQESRVDKERRYLENIACAPDELWVRLDILQGRTGYDRRRHVDHRRRAISMLIYFCDADDNQMVGGDLLLHGRDGPVTAVRPRHNRMAVFPCHGASFHSVSPIVSQAHPRNFVQVTVSSSVDIWRQPLLEEARGNLRRLASRGKRLLTAGRAA
jgi:hypothetical protein